MRPWSPHLYREQAVHAGTSSTIAENAVAEMQAFLAVSPSAAPIMTLGHLAHETGVSHNFLRRVIDRSLSQSYVRFTTIGRSQKRREIATPTRDLMLVQRWIAENVLARLHVGPNSYAYAKGSSIVSCASAHCSSRWLVKMDVRKFFSSIDERQIYSIFVDLGYRALVAFELARLCTWPANDAPNRLDAVYADRSGGPNYRHGPLGSLPIGAPTSPMLSNLYMALFDHKLSVHAARNSLVYSRYADDIFLSSSNHSFKRIDAIRAAQFVREELTHIGLFDNRSKSTIVPPGGRKIVLGLIVNGVRPQLSPEFKKRLRMHYHYIDLVGAMKHASRRNFASVPTLERHLRGSIAYARQIDSEYADAILLRHEKINWGYLA